MPALHRGCGGDRRNGGHPARPNPIHLDPAAAAAAGLGDRVINQGPANLAYIMDLLTTEFPGHLLAPLQSRYLGNVRDQDRLEIGATITAMTNHEVQCRAWVKTPDGRRAVEADATLLVR
jgi:acyl dehydratase